MEIENELDGTIVTLDPGDDLALVPEPHQNLLTPDIHSVFKNATSYFEKIRDRSPFPGMKKWFTRALRYQILLRLEVGGPNNVLRKAGFFLLGKTIWPAIVGLPRLVSSGVYPKPLEEYYRLVSFSSFTGLMCAGGLWGPSTTTLADFYYRGSEIDPATTRIIGDSFCGDMMVCTADGRGGWWMHETGEVRLDGPIAEFMNWVYDELLDGRRPESDSIPRNKSRNTN